MTLAAFAPALEALFGVPVAVFAGCLGGILLAVIRLEPGDRFASWRSIVAHYAGALFITSMALWYWREALEAVPKGGIGFVVGFALLFLLPGAVDVLKKAPELLWGRWFNRGAAPTPPPADDKGGQ